METVCGAKNGVDAFGFFSAEGELIWMKSGALWARCWGLALADFGCDPRSSDSLRGSRNFLSSKRTMSPISRPINSTTFKHSVDQWGGKTFGTKFWKFYREGSFFQKKTQKLLTKFLGLATSGRRNSAMITDRRKFATNLTLYGMSSLHFYR